MHPCACGAAAKGAGPLKCCRYGDSISAARAAQKNITSDMNKHQRQGREPADQTTLPDDIDEELSRITTEVIDVSDAPSIAPPAPLSPDEVRTILMSLLLTMFLAALDQTIVATALPTIGRQFNDVSNLSWVITAYLLASTAVAPVFGTLSDIYGRRVMITVSLVLFTVGSILCAVAPNMTVLIVARGLQGLGGEVSGALWTLETEGSGVSYHLDDSTATVRRYTFSGNNPSTQPFWIAVQRPDVAGRSNPVRIDSLLATVTDF